MLKMPDLKLQDWEEKDRPREKLLEHGGRYLSDAELLAILLRTGTRVKDAVSLARELLALNRNQLRNLARCEANELSSLPGIGPVKAATILASFELGRRMETEQAEPPLPIQSSAKAAAQISARLRDLNHEEFHILLLNRANHLINTRLISKGGFHGTVVDARIIFRAALEVKASGIILAHNHPSGNLRPSDNDIALTRKLKTAATNLDLQLIDHLIIAGSSFYSFADEGLL